MATKLTNHRRYFPSSTLSLHLHIMPQSGRYCFMSKGRRISMDYERRGRKKLINYEKTQLDTALRDLLSKHRNGEKTNVFATAARFRVPNSTLFDHFKAALESPSSSSALPQSSSLSVSSSSTKLSNIQKERRGRNLNDNDKKQLCAAVRDLLRARESGHKTNIRATAVRFNVPFSTLRNHFSAALATSSSSSSPDKGSIGYILSSKPGLQWFTNLIWVFSLKSLVHYTFAYSSFLIQIEHCITAFQSHLVE